MAKIVHSDAAPAEAVHYSFAGVEFDLGGSNKAFETDDPSVISNARVNPWLSVEVDPASVVQGTYVQQIDPKNDPLSAVGSINANDPEEVRKAEAAKSDSGKTQDVAIDAGKTQTKPVVTGDVAETLAADESSKTNDKVEKNS
jgi:hypothetical protein